MAKNKHRNWHNCRNKVDDCRTSLSDLMLMLCLIHIVSDPTDIKFEDYRKCRFYIGRVLGII